MALLSTLDLFVAATMHRTPELLRHVATFGVSEPHLVEAEAWAGHSGLLQHVGRTPALIEQCFGAPRSRDSHAITYNLDFLPQHVFRWGIGISGLAYPIGIELRFPALSHFPGDDLATVISRLRVWYDTESMVRDALGMPAFDGSWGHLGELYYRSTVGNGSWLLMFDYGLLTAIRKDPALAGSIGN